MKYSVIGLFAHLVPQANEDYGGMADFRQGFADVPISTPG
jgi:hypothetical protein